MNVRDGAAAPVDLMADAADALFVRPWAEIQARRMPGGGFEFVAALAHGETVLTATKEAIGACATFAIAAKLSGPLDTGAIVGFAHDEKPLNASEHCR